MHRVAVYASGYFDGFLTAYCVDMSNFLNTATQYWTTPTADANNTYHIATCAAGYAATGIKAYATAYLDYGLSLQCTALKTGFTQNTIPNSVRSNFDAWCGADNVFHDAACPAGTFVDGVAVYASTYLDCGLQLTCSYISW